MPFEEEEIASLRTRLWHELQEELLAWFRVRFWGAAVVIAVISFFGVRGIVQQVFDVDLKQAREQTTQIIIQASTAAALAKNAAERAGNAADDVEKDFSALKAELAASRDLIRV